MMMMMIAHSLTPTIWFIYSLCCPSIANQALRFVVVDIDNKSSTRVEDQDLIGEMECSLGEIVGARGSSISRKLVIPRNPNKIRGFIHIRAEEVDGVNDLVHLQISSTNLDKKDWFGKSDPFLVISRSNEDGHYQPVFKSEHHKRTLNCTWKPFTVSVQKLCNGDHLRSLKIEVFDHKKSGKHKFIGHVNVSLKELLHSGTGSSFDLINPKKQKKKGSKYTNSGTIKLENISVEKVFSFLDYIRGGYDINLVVAIDFTASNGDPRQPNTLHYTDPNRTSMNSYQRAIYSVGNILTHYDSDKMYPVYGFGAKIPPQYHVSHCFPINFNWQAPEVYGVQGILQAYQHSLSQITLHGPTNFAPIITVTANEARKNAETSYYILLIITDGEITDMDNTIHEIVESSDLPLSIIIVGVGGADFSKMDILDADDNPLMSRGRKQTRDNVQFVPFRNFQNGPASLLAEEVLREVPEQFLSYMIKNKVRPNAPIQPSPLEFSGHMPNQSPVHHPMPQQPPYHMSQQIGRASCRERVL